MWTQSVKAVLLSTALGYLIPLTLLWLVGLVVFRVNSQPLLDAYAFLLLLYVMLFAPVFTGYFAAKRAPSLPIWHGLVAVFFSIALYIFMRNPQPLWLIVPLSLVLGVIGARRFKIEGNDDNNL